MDINSFVAELRDHYVDQFKAFVRTQREGSARGASEVKLLLNDNPIFERLYCADFVHNDEQPEIVEFLPESFLSFDALTSRFGDAALTIDHLRWDDVLIRHDLELPDDALRAWFRRWFDPEDERHIPNPALSNVIHSLLVRPGVLSLDFGTAGPEAFWELLALLERAGATTIQVSSTRAEANDPRERTANGWYDA